VHPKLARSLALVTIVLLQNGKDKSLLEFPNGFRIKDSTFIHLHYECFELVLHGDPFLMPCRGSGPLKSLYGSSPLLRDCSPGGFFIVFRPGSLAFADGLYALAESFTKFVGCYP